MARSLGRVSRNRVECVDGIVVGPDGRILMVRRGHEPARGTWSVPGGRVEPGETDAEATAREVREETGVHVHVGTYVGTAQVPTDGTRYAIAAYRCTPVDGIDPQQVCAGDDADEAGWFTPAEIRGLDCSPGLVEELAAWGFLQ